MIKALAILGALCSAGHALADQACLDQNFPVVDARLDDDRIGVDFHNDTEFPVIGYNLVYVFHTADGVVTEDLPSFVLKQSIMPGAVHTHRMRLAYFEIDTATITDVKAHVAGVQQDVGIGQSVDTPLARLLENCEET